MTLWTVRRSVLQASLWKTITTLVVGRLSGYTFVLHLEEANAFVKLLRQQNPVTHTRTADRGIKAVGSRALVVQLSVTSHLFRFWLMLHLIKQYLKLYMLRLKLF